MTCRIWAGKDDHEAGTPIEASPAAAEVYRLISRISRAVAIASRTLATTWRRAGARHLVAGLGLEQLGVGKNDPELVVQAVKQQAEI